MKKHKQEDKKVQAGDQSIKIQHKGKKLDQGDSCCGPADFDKLAGQEGALQMSPKVKKQPTKGPFDALKGKKAGQSISKPDSGEKHHKEEK